jgi:hypothetical protein
VDVCEESMSELPSGSSGVKAGVILAILLLWYERKYIHHNSVRGRCSFNLIVILNTQTGMEKVKSWYLLAAFYSLHSRVGTKFSP